MVLAKWIVAHGTEYYCLGRWELTVDGVDYSDAIPVEKRTSPMDTLLKTCEYKTSGHFIHKYEGKEYMEWCGDNQWVYNIPVDPIEVYNAFALYDWKCGGACATCVRKEKENSG